MKRILLIFIAATLHFSLLAISKKHQDLPQGIHWHHGTVATGLKAARQQHRPLFLFWSAKWCAPCNLIKTTLLTKKEVQERINHFIPLYLDFDDPLTLELAKKWHIKGPPEILLLNEQGSERSRFLPSLIPAEKFLSLLDSPSFSDDKKYYLKLPATFHNKEWDWITKTAWMESKSFRSRQDQAQILKKLYLFHAKIRPSLVAERIPWAISLITNFPMLLSFQEKESILSDCLHHLKKSPLPREIDFELLNNYLLLAKNFKQQLAAAVKDFFQRLLTTPHISNYNSLVLQKYLFALESLHQRNYALRPKERHHLLELVARLDQEFKNSPTRYYMINSAIVVLASCGMKEEALKMALQESKNSEQKASYLEGAKELKQEIEKAKVKEKRI